MRSGLYRSHSFCVQFPVNPICAWPRIFTSLLAICVAEIKRINKLNDSFLRIGQNLLLPIKDKANVKTVEKNNSADTQYYVVKRGDNPWTIAIKHDMKVSDLLRLNNLNKEKAKRLRPGDKLRIR